MCRLGFRSNFKYFYFPMSFIPSVQTRIRILKSDDRTQPLFPVIIDDVIVDATSLPVCSRYTPIGSCWLF